LLRESAEKSFARKDIVYHAFDIHLRLYSSVLPCLLIFLVRRLVSIGWLRGAFAAQPHYLFACFLFSRCRHFISLCVMPVSPRESLYYAFTMPSSIASQRVTRQPEYFAFFPPFCCHCEFAVATAFDASEFAARVVAATLVILPCRRFTTASLSQPYERGFRARGEKRGSDRSRKRSCLQKI